MMKKNLILLAFLMVTFLMSCEDPEPSQVNFDCEVSTDIWIYDKATMSINIISSTTCRVRVEWGDNTVDDWGSPYQASHTYQNVGQYNARVIVTPDNENDYKAAEKNYTIKVFNLTGYNIELNWGPYPGGEANAYTYLYPLKNQNLKNTFLFEGYVGVGNFDSQPLKTLSTYLDFPEDIILYVDYKIYTPHVGGDVKAGVIVDLITQEYLIVGQSTAKWLMNWKGVYLYWFAVLLRGDVTKYVKDKEVSHSAVGKRGNTEYKINALGMKITLTPCKSYSASEMERDLSEIEKEIIGKLIASWTELLSNINARINLPIVRLLDYYAGDNIEN